MIVTEIQNSQSDSEDFSAFEVIEVPETETQLNYEILTKSLGYYLEEDDILGKRETEEKVQFSWEEDVCDEIKGEVSGNSKEFKPESFLKTFKTLVDTVTEPVVEEFSSRSSTNSEVSEDESYSLLPVITSLSTKFINQTSKFFRGESEDEGDIKDLIGDKDGSDGGEDLKITEIDAKKDHAVEHKNGVIDEEEEIKMLINKKNSEGGTNKNNEWNIDGLIKWF